jgi:hypothetical protein
VAVERHETAGASQLPNPTPGGCQVLDLVLPPIHLNVLGVRVATSRIALLVESTRAPATCSATCCAGSSESSTRGPRRRRRRRSSRRS